MSGSQVGGGQSYSILAILAGLYAAQSITGSMVQTALPVVLRDAGLPLDSIGYLSVLFLPWALKFLWAPLVDRVGNERRWILSCQIGLIVCFALAAAFPPSLYLPALSVLLLIMAFVATTQDVATDSLGVHATRPESRGGASGASTAGGYLGFLIGGGLWLPVYDHVGWAASMMIMALCIGLLTLPTLMANRLPTPAPTIVPAPHASLLAVRRNKALMAGLGFMIVYQSGVRLGISMVGPLLVDQGISLAAIGWIKGAGGAAAGILAALFGAAVAQRLGVGRALAAFAGLNLLAALGLAGFSIGLWRQDWVLIGLLLFQGAAVAMSFVALYAAMMNWCAPRQAATDFAVLQSIDAALAIAMGTTAGLLGQRFGYATIFVVAAILLALGALLSFRAKSIASADSTQSGGHSPELRPESLP